MEKVITWLLLYSMTVDCINEFIQKKPITCRWLKNNTGKRNKIDRYRHVDRQAGGQVVRQVDRYRHADRHDSSVHIIIGLHQYTDYSVSKHKSMNVLSSCQKTNSEHIAVSL